MKMKKLPLRFFMRPDVVQIAKDLLGKVLVTGGEGGLVSGRITETEAYQGMEDQASHASKGRTARTEVMFGEGGKVYVYLCYGIHQMFNIVTNVNGIPDAVLIRSVEPLEGRELMLKRTGKKKADTSMTTGPGKLGKAFAFHTSQCGISLDSDEIYIGDDGTKISESQIIASPRIGVAYAGDHANWHYRFYIKDSLFVSGRR